MESLSINTFQKKTRLQITIFNFSNKNICEKVEIIQTQTAVNVLQWDKYK